MSHPLGCDDVRTVAFEHRRRELGAPTAALVDAHLAACSACATYLGNLEVLLVAAARADEPVSAAAIDRMWIGIAAALPDSAAPTPRRRWPLAAGIAAAAVLALAAGRLAAPEPVGGGASTAARAIAALPTSGPPPRLTAPRSEPAPSPAEPVHAPPAPVALPPVVARARALPPRPPIPVVPTAPLRTAPPTAPVGPTASTVADWMSTSDRLQRERRFDDAVAGLERLVETRALTGSDLAAVRLELARLYEHQLGQPRRAAHHLRQFLAADPADPAAASVFRELCRLSSAAGVAEPLCPQTVARARGRDRRP